MRFLITASIPFESMRRRQQQVALGLARMGHEVLYLNPPRPVRALIDPSRFELQELEDLPEGDQSEVAAGEVIDAVDITDEAEFAGSEPIEGEVRINGIFIKPLAPGLHVAEKGVAMAAMGRWGWATRAGWKLWSAEVQRVIGTLANEGEANGFGFKPDVVFVYHPALIPAVREVFPGPLVFDCLDNFASLTRSKSIAAAHEEAMNNAAEHIDGMISVNRYILESWERLLRPDVPTAVIEHGVDLSLFKSTEMASRQKIRSVLGVPDGKKMICYLGRFDERISFEDLETMIGLDDNTVFQFVGEMNAEGRSTIQRLPSDRIFPVGPLRPEQAAEVVAAADLLIFPFRREPHLEAIRGLKLYEYFATGRPVLASFRRALKEYREITYLYATREELEENFKRALLEPEESALKPQRQAVAAAADWNRRVTEIARFIEEMTEGSVLAPK
jgi:glycosyltransferase involved in cell wall biosynthesis